MRLIEKIILLLLGISLVPLLATGGMLYLSAQHDVKQQTESNLNSIATIQEHRIASIRSQNLERLSNFTGRLQLKLLIDQYNRTHTSRDQVQLTENLNESKRADRNFDRITIMSPTGTVIASTDEQLTGKDLSTGDLFKQGRDHNDIKLVGQVSGQDPVFYVSGPLVLNDQTIGVAGIEVSANELLASVHDYTGLGETGEIELAERNQNGQPTFITSLRSDKHAAFHRIITNPRSPMFEALMGKTTTLTSLVDYRGKSVLAATRYIKNSKWGMVVKIDRAEAFQPSTLLRSEFLMLAFISSVLVVFTAVALAQRIIQPILDIDEVAEDVSRGELLNRVQGMSHDEIGNLANTFNTMLDSLEELDRAKSDFVSLASHQLRTPATGVKAIIGLMLKDYNKDLTPKQRTYLEQAFDSNERQLRVINDLLSVAMLESGKLKLTKTSTDIKTLVESTATEQRLTAKSRQQTIALSMPSSPLKVAVDAEKFRMVLDNLVSNASKYTPDGGTITISVRKNASKVTIAISDTGVGISQKDIKKLFQKFSQIDNHLAHKGGGSAGLGLYLAKKVVELHDGKIKVDSRLGEGTTFSVELPYGTA